VELLEPLADKTVLIVGAAGGVGSFATQFAASAGANVIANARSSDAERMRSYGAAETIDHTAVALADGIRQTHPDGVVRDVDQCVDELNLRHPRLQQILQAVGGILFWIGLETREVELGFVAIDGEHRIVRHSAVNAGSQRVQPLLELREVRDSVDRQSERAIVLFALRCPGRAWEQILLENGPAARPCDRGVHRRELVAAQQQHVAAGREGGAHDVAGDLEREETGDGVLVHARLPLGHGVWVFDASDTNNYEQKLTIPLRLPSPYAAFEARAFGPFLVIRTRAPTRTRSR